MSDDDAIEILNGIEGPVRLRSGFEEELLAFLESELEGSESAVATKRQIAPGRRLRDRLATLRAPRSWRMAALAAGAAVALVVGVAVVDDSNIEAPPADEQVAVPGGPNDPWVPGGPNDPSVPGGPNDPSEPGGPGDDVPVTDHNRRPSSDDTPRLTTVSPDAGRYSAPRPPDEAPPSRPLPPDEEPSDLLAFASKGEDGYWHIFTMHSDGSRRRQLTQAEAHDREPDWSPDGRKIAFVRLANEGDHSGEIWVVNADGSNARYLTDGAEPQWSPDGNRIAFTGPPTTSNPTGQPVTIWVMDPDGSNAYPLYEGPGVVADATWSPRGLLAMAGAAVDVASSPSGSKTTNLFTMTEDGTLKRRLTDTYYACNSEFSPNGSRLTFIRSNGGPFVIWTMNPDGSDKTQLTEGPGTYAFPHWSPDARRIAFGFDPDGEPHWTIIPAAAGPALPAIWMMDADGSDLQRISPEGVADADPAFAPRTEVALAPSSPDRETRTTAAASAREPKSSVC